MSFRSFRQRDIVPLPAALTLFCHLFTRMRQICRDRQALKFGKLSSSMRNIWCMPSCDTGIRSCRGMHLRNFSCCSSAAAEP